MAKRGRQFSAEEKLKILEEARQPNTTVAEVFRRYQVEGATFYRWERDAKAAMRAALGERAKGREVDKKDRRIARLEAELERKRRIIAEVVGEKLGLIKVL